MVASSFKESPERYWTFQFELRYSVWMHVDAKSMQICPQNRFGGTLELDLRAAYPGYDLNLQLDSWCSLSVHYLFNVQCSTGFICVAMECPFSNSESKVHSTKCSSYKIASRSNKLAKISRNLAFRKTWNDTSRNGFSQSSELSKITLIKAQHVAVDASPEETYEYLRLVAAMGTNHATNPHFPK